MEESQIKIRKNFVSNSSSSSYIITGEQITFEEAKNFDDVIWLTERECSCGEDYIKLSKEMIEHIMKHKDNLDISFEDGFIVKNSKWEDPYYKNSNDGFGFEYNNEDKPKFYIEYDIDQNSTEDDLREFNRRYLK